MLFELILPELACVPSILRRFLFHDQIENRILFDQRKIMLKYLFVTKKTTIPNSSWNLFYVNPNPENWLPIILCDLSFFALLVSAHSFSFFLSEQNSRFYYRHFINKHLRFALTEIIYHSISVIIFVVEPRSLFKLSNWMHTSENGEKNKISKWFVKIKNSTFYWDNRKK